jgi:hypothetical protein
MASSVRTASIAPPSSSGTNEENLAPASGHRLADQLGVVAGLHDHQQVSLAPRGVLGAPDHLAGERALGDTVRTGPVGVAPRVS